MNIGSCSNGVPFIVVKCKSCEANMLEGKEKTNMKNRKHISACSSLVHAISLLKHNVIYNVRPIEITRRFTLSNLFNATAHVARQVHIEIVKRALLTGPAVIFIFLRAECHTHANILKPVLTTYHTLHKFRIFLFTYCGNYA